MNWLLQKVTTLCGSLPLDKRCRKRSSSWLSERSTDEQTLSPHAIIQRWEGYSQNRKHPAADPERPCNQRPPLQFPGLTKGNFVRGILHKICGKCEFQQSLKSSKKQSARGKLGQFVLMKSPCFF
jgi:hypothetical protein